jgi:DNA-binding response OmpR family regulator
VSTGSERATVLVVDDEEEVADVYALRLRNEYETRTAYGGAEALETIDEDIDIVLLDRRMPDVHGDDVLAEIRERGYDVKVIMLTAVDPGTEIMEMDFDDYLCKPVEKADLVAAIDHQLRVNHHDDRLSEYLEVTSKLALLESELSSQAMEESDRFQNLRERAEQLEAEMDEAVDELEEIEAAFHDISRHPD